jgi:hypothetical protein
MVGLYERLLAEAAQEEKEREDPEQEQQRRRQAHKRQKMQAYINSRWKPVPESGGGYVTAVEMKKEQERYLADLKTLSHLTSGGVRSMGSSYRLVYLMNKYPVEYAHLRDIEISSG